MWTDDPVTDEMRYTLEQEKRISALPVCSDCGEHIQDEYYYEFGEQIYCSDCCSEHIVWL